MTTAGTAGTAAIPALRELPAGVQSQIPPVIIGGYLYASDPASRSVLINNRLAHEGEQLAPGLTLERMTPTGAVMNYRGTRYFQAY